jgi:hypothetical protein
MKRNALKVIKSLELENATYVMIENFTHLAEAVYITDIHTDKIKANLLIEIKRINTKCVDITKTEKLKDQFYHSIERLTTIRKFYADIDENHETSWPYAYEWNLLNNSSITVKQIAMHYATGYNNLPFAVVYNTLLNDKTSTIGDIFTIMFNIDNCKQMDKCNDLFYPIFFNSYDCSITELHHIIETITNIDTMHHYELDESEINYILYGLKNGLYIMEGDQSAEVAAIIKRL